MTSLMSKFLPLRAEEYLVRCKLPRRSRVDHMRPPTHVLGHFGQCYIGVTNLGTKNIKTYPFTKLDTWMFPKCVGIELH